MAEDTGSGHARRSFMDIVDGRGVTALFRIVTFLFLSHLTILGFLGQGALSDIRDLRQLMAKVDVELARLTGVTVLSAAVTANHEVRILKLEEWRLSRPFREP